MLSLSLHNVSHIVIALANNLWTGIAGLFEYSGTHHSELVLPRFVVDRRCSQTTFHNRLLNLVQRCDHESQIRKSE